MQHHPVICQHAIWGSKQQRYRHCKLPAKLSAPLFEQIKRLEEQCFITERAADGHDLNEQARRTEEYLRLRTELLQPEYDAQRVLCGHHQKEAQVAQAAFNRIEREKEAGTYQDPEELKRLAKDQPVDPKDIPKDFLAAVQRVFSNEPSTFVKEVLDQCDGPEEWKAGQESLRAEKSGPEVDPVNSEFPCHESYEGLFADAGVKKKRHLAQESQLIQAMASLGLLDPVLREGGIAKATKDEQMKQERRPVFVEFGAGTGGLSRHLQLVLESVISKRVAGPAEAPEEITMSTIDPFNFVLLDRQKFRSRNQVDYMIRTQARPVKPRLLRVTKDVRELSLQNLQLIHETEPGIARPEWSEGGGAVDPQETSTRVPTHYICISKHFCGPATDLALAWMMEQQQQQPERERQDVYSICFATCCHGICEPSLVVAKPYLKELFNATCAKKRKRTEGGQENDLETSALYGQQQLAVSEEQLSSWVPWMIKLTGWATLGKQDESSLVARPGKDAHTIALPNGVDGETMTRDQRRVLGKRCKKLLDMARCMYLIRECGFKEAKAIEYTAESVESGAIVGTM
ncbi:methyltransferase TRM13-domain-containing protein [Dissophora ornata]|nr:methyltransferase TRM13-domain-containing protein [Dissophora ornata]